ncbi:hypothetical protein, partial [Aerococcus loyolae]|uniref:hypothetical protein n=1 Tax=Aerococcus loyolae TaxID=2976809 RepID=UPI0034D21055
MSIDELAESIARRGLIQSLHVRPVLDAEGTETGMFEVPAGGRRYRARTARQAEAPRQDRARALRRRRRRQRHSDRRNLAGREHRPRSAASARPVSGVSGDARQGHDRRGDRCRLLRRRQCGEAALAPRVGLSEAARHLCRGRHDARNADGLHRFGRPCQAGTGLGDDRCRLAEGAVADQADADRNHGARLRQAGRVRRRRRLRGGRRHRAARSVPVRRRWRASGCRPARSPG